jgi:hypothetical protein
MSHTTVKSITYLKSERYNWEVDNDRSQFLSYGIYTLQKIRTFWLSPGNTKSAVRHSSIALLMNWTSMPSVALEDLGQVVRPLGSDGGHRPLHWERWVRSQFTSQKSALGGKILAICDEAGVKWRWRWKRHGGDSDEKSRILMSRLRHWMNKNFSM